MEMEVLIGDVEQMLTVNCCASWAMCVHVHSRVHDWQRKMVREEVREETRKEAAYDF
jgi:hypothetical protein